MAAIKEVCNTRRSSINTRHSQLGHPSFKLVEQIISSNNLLYTQESVTRTICNICQQAKSHQLPYPKSTSVSEFPLQLVHSDVLGPALESVGRKNIMLALWMISVNSHGFILSNLNLMCFRSFRVFRLLLRDNLIARSLPYDLIREASTSSLIHSSTSLALSIMYLALMHINKMEP
jgi:hypothetical protein